MRGDNPRRRRRVTVLVSSYALLAVFVTVAAQTGGEVFGGEQSHSRVGWPLAIGVATVLAGLWALRPQAA